MTNYECFQREIPIFLPELTPVQRMVTELKSRVIIPNIDLGLPFTSLIPLVDQDVYSGLPYKWARALSDHELSLGYLPTTPKTMAGWVGVLNLFLSDPNTLLYRVMGRQYPDETLAEIKFIFFEKGEELIAEFAYGLLDPNQKGMSIVTSAFLFLRDVLPNMVESCGMDLSALRSNVSDRNTPSLRIMEKAGLQRRDEQTYPLSSIVMGGSNIAFEYLYK